jgi:hypothetical protein
VSPSDRLLGHVDEVDRFLLRASFEASNGADKRLLESPQCRAYPLRWWWLRFLRLFLDDLEVGLDRFSIIRR